MYVCRTFERTVTIVVLEDDGEGECEMIPAPSLLAEPSIPRQSNGRADQFSKKVIPRDADRLSTHMLVGGAKAFCDCLMLVPWL